ncbi:hypothetical protein H8F22_02340 [Pseudomonas sp. P154a]|uniref:hypothetical protein n=1 Tax=Pseudomonas mucoides TaxID=2730424 RepID=UPI001891F65F|nr:hypothetical protein [Pseudomonas mucoides]MBF6037708.1 hypothetical protein [Pseudomonas mucoides]
MRLTIEGLPRPVTEFAATGERLSTMGTYPHPFMEAVRCNGLQSKTAVLAIKALFQFNSISIDEAHWLTLVASKLLFIHARVHRIIRDSHYLQLIGIR